MTTLRSMLEEHARGEVSTERLIRTLELSVTRGTEPVRILRPIKARFADGRIDPETYALITERVYAAAAQRGGGAEANPPRESGRQSAKHGPKSDPSAPQPPRESTSGTTPRTVGTREGATDANTFDADKTIVRSAPAKSDRTTIRQAPPQPTQPDAHAGASPTEDDDRTTIRPKVRQEAKAITGEPSPNQPRSSDDATTIRSTPKQPAASTDATTIRSTRTPKEAAQDATTVQSTRPKSEAATDATTIRSKNNPPPADDSTTIRPRDSSGATDPTTPPPITEAPDQLLVAGYMLGKFRLERELGRGGMGVVWKAVDTTREAAGDVEPFVALKVLNQKISADNWARTLLRTETTKSQRLRDPRIVAVHDFDQVGAHAYMHMELLQGRPLDRYIDEEVPLEGKRYDEVEWIVENLSEGLAAAHAQDVIHSDLKPSNVFLTDANEVKILDFGIARVANEERLGNVTAQDLGALTEAYATIEMFDGADPDPRDDIYALGCVLYEILGGGHPYDRYSAPDALAEGITPDRIKHLRRHQWQALSRTLELRRQDRTERVSQFLSEIRGDAVKRTRQIVLGAIVGVLVLVAALTPAALNFLQDRADQEKADEILNARSATQMLAVVNAVADPEQKKRVLARDDVSQGLISAVLAEAAKVPNTDDALAAQAKAQKAGTRNTPTHPEALVLLGNAVKVVDRRPLWERQDELEADLKTKVEKVLTPAVDDALQNGRLLDKPEGVPALWRQMLLLRPLDDLNALILPAYRSAIEQAIGESDFPYAEALLAASVAIVDASDPKSSGQARPTLAALGDQNVELAEAITKSQDAEDRAAQVAVLERKIQATGTAGDFEAMLKLAALNPQSQRLAEARAAVEERATSQLAAARAELAKNTPGPAKSALSEAFEFLDQLKPGLVDARFVGTHRAALQRVADQLDTRSNQFYERGQRQRGAAQEATYRDGLAWAYSARQRGKLDRALGKGVKQTLADAKAAWESALERIRLGMTRGDLEDAVVAASALASASTGDTQAALEKVLFERVASVAEKAVQAGDLLGAASVLATASNLNAGAVMGTAVTDLERRLLAQIKATVAGTLTRNSGEELERAFAALEQLSAGGYKVNLDEAKDGASKAYRQTGEELIAAEDFDGARALVESAPNFVDRAVVRRIEQQAGAGLQGIAERQRAAQQVDGLQQNFKTYVAGRDVKRMDKTVAELTKLRSAVPAGTLDSFFADVVPTAYRDVYLSLAEGPAKRGDYDRALALIKAGERKAGALAGTLRDKKNEYGVFARIQRAVRSGDVSRVRRTNGDVELARRDFRETFDARLNAWDQMAANALEKLGATDNAKSFQEAALNLLGLPASSKTAKVEIPETDPKIEAAMSSLKARELTKAENLLRGVTHPEARALRAEIDAEKTKGLAEIAKANAAIRDTDKPKAETALQAARLIWVDHPDYQQLERDIRGLRRYDPRPLIKKFGQSYESGKPERVRANLGAMEGAFTELRKNAPQNDQLPKLSKQLDQYRQAVPIVEDALAKPEKSKVVRVASLLGEKHALVTELRRLITPPDACAKAFQSRGPGARCRDGDGPKVDLIVVPPVSGGTALAVGRFEVSVKDMRAYCQSASCPAFAGDGGVTALGVSRATVNGYAAWLGRKTGFKYRLPTLAEWRHAARANGVKPEQVWCVLGNIRGGRPGQVRNKSPNGWNVYNMIGNAQEWTQDGVAAGGSYRDDEGSPECSVDATRSVPASGDEWTGFRLVRTVR